MSRECFFYLKLIFSIVPTFLRNLRVSKASININFVLCLRRNPPARFTKGLFGDGSFPVIKRGELFNRFCFMTLFLIPLPPLD